MSVNNNKQLIVHISIPSLAPQTFETMEIKDFFSKYYRENQKINNIQFHEVGLKNSLDLSVICNNLNRINNIHETINEIKCLIHPPERLKHEDVKSLLSRVTLFLNDTSFTSLLNGMDLKKLPEEHREACEKLKECLALLLSLEDTDPVACRDPIASLLSMLEQLKSIEGKKVFLELKEYVQQYQIKAFWKGYPEKTLSSLNSSVVSCSLLFNLKQRPFSKPQDQEPPFTYNPQKETLISQLPGELLTFIILLSENESALSHVSHLFRTLTLVPETVQLALKKICQGMPISENLMQTLLKECASDEEIKKNPFVLLRGLQLKLARCARIENAEKFSFFELHDVFCDLFSQLNEGAFRKLFVENSLSNNFYPLLLLSMINFKKLDRESLTKAFLHAAKKGYVASTTILLNSIERFYTSHTQEEPSLPAKDNHLETLPSFLRRKALILAAENNHLEILELLLPDSPSELNARKKIMPLLNEETYKNLFEASLVSATKGGHFDLVKNIMERGKSHFDKNSVDAALEKALKYNHTEIANYFMGLTEMTFSPENVIHYEASLGNLELVKEKLNQVKRDVGVSKKTRKKCYERALSGGLEHGQAHLVQKLLKDAVKRKARLGGNAVSAALNNHWEMVLSLLGNKSFISLLSNDSLGNIIEIAAEKGCWEIAFSLLKKTKTLELSGGLFRFFEKLLAKGDEEEIEIASSLFSDKTTVFSLLTKHALKNHDLALVIDYNFKLHLESCSEKEKDFLTEKFNLLKKEFCEHFLFSYGLPLAKKEMEREEILKIGRERFLKTKHNNDIHALFNLLIHREIIIPSLKKALLEKDNETLDVLLDEDNHKITCKTFLLSSLVSIDEKIQFLDAWGLSDVLDSRDSLIYSIILEKGNLAFIDELLTTWRQRTIEVLFRTVSSLFRTAYEKKCWEVFYRLAKLEEIQNSFLLDTLYRKIGKRGNEEVAKKLFAIVPNKDRILDGLFRGAFKANQHHLIKWLMIEFATVSIHDQCSEEDKKALENLYSLDALEREFILQLGRLHGEEKNVHLKTFEEMFAYGKELYFEKEKKAIKERNLTLAIQLSAFSETTRHVSHHANFPKVTFSTHPSEVIQTREKNYTLAQLTVRFCNYLFYLHHELEIPSEEDLFADTKDKKDFRLGVILKRLEISQEKINRASLQAAIHLTAERLKQAVLQKKNSLPIDVLLGDLHACGIDLSAMQGLLKSTTLSTERKLQVIDNFLTRIRTKQFWESSSNVLTKRH
jgi:hypothetical protein